MQAINCFLSSETIQLSLWVIRNFFSAYIEKFSLLSPDVNKNKGVSKKVLLTVCKCRLKIYNSSLYEPELLQSRCKESILLKEKKKNRVKSPAFFILLTLSSTQFSKTLLLLKEQSNPDFVTQNVVSVFSPKPQATPQNVLFLCSPSKADRPNKGVVLPDY